MLDYHFDLPVRLYAGEGCVRRDGAAMKALGSRCLLVTGPTSAKKSGARKGEPCGRRLFSQPRSRFVRKCVRLTYLAR